ncbi:MAG: hypothetical protein AABW99_05320 [archaeon]
MAVSKKQLYSLIIIAIMVGSIAGFVSLSGNGSSNPNSNAPPLDPNTAPPTTIRYTASNIEATVTMVFPTVVLIAKTNAFDVATVNAELLGTEGVSSVTNSQFIEAQQSGENFRADVRLSSSDGIEGAMQKMELLDSLSQVSLYPQALVTVPQETHFVNTEADLTKDYNITNQSIQAIVDSGTRQGDKLTVTVSATFQGDLIVGYPQALIENNLASAPTFYSTEGSFKISALGNDFRVVSSANLSEKQKLDSIRAAIEGIDGVSDSTLQVSAASGTMAIFFKDANSFSAQDLNTFFTDYAGISSFNLQLAQGYASIALPQDVNADSFAGFKAKLEKDLNGLRFNVSGFQEPNALLNGTITASGPNAISSQISALEKDFNATINLLQGATFDADSIFVADANASFALKDGNFTAFVKPVHSQGDDVNLSIVMFASERTGITDLQAQEAPTGQADARPQ